MKKSDETKQKLFQIAIDLIAKEGFEATTMRKIAAEADMAPGAIYYYYESKERIVQEYYQLSQKDHERVLLGYFETEKRFAKRLQHVVRSKIQVAEPYKPMAIALFSAAANPNSSLSPFSAESKTTRGQALGMFEELVATSKDKFHPEIKRLLPKFLWLYEMGVILFWIYDRSKGSENTFRLIDKTVPLIEQLNSTLNSPLGSFLRRRVVSILKEFEPAL